MTKNCNRPTRSAPVSVFALVTAAALLAACQQEAPPQPKLPRLVNAMRVADTSGFMERSFPGRARAGKEVNQSFRVNGPLVTFPVTVGDKVKKGGVLARIDPRDYEVRLENIQARLARERANLKAMRQARPEELRQAKDAVTKAEAANTLAKQEYDRIMRIFNKDPGAVSQSMVDRVTADKNYAEAILRQAREGLNIAGAGARKEDIEAKEADIRSLKAAVDSAKDQLKYTYLRAPFDGIVVETYVENFETVRPRQPILRVVDPSSIEFVVNVPENLISLAPYVEKITVAFDALPGVEIPAKISEIGTEASQATRTYPVTLLMDQPDDAEILPGMAGEARTVARPPEEAELAGLQIPATAVFSGDDRSKNFVWVVDAENKTLSRREVQLGQLARFGVSLRSGLQAGEWIVTKGVNSLEEGQQVRILDTATTGENTQ
jgi:RND family efflux transporter MFP subunit